VGQFRGQALSAQRVLLALADTVVSVSFSTRAVPAGKSGNSPPTCFAPARTSASIEPTAPHSVGT
jgi:hypothetical protein